MKGSDAARVSRAEAGGESATGAIMGAGSEAGQVYLSFEEHMWIALPLIDQRMGPDGGSVYCSVTLGGGAKKGARQVAMAQGYQKEEVPPY